jgi:spermidine synthase
MNKKISYIRELLVSNRLMIISFISGACVLIFELTATRISAPYLGTTIYVWTSIIGVILAALAAGYAYGGYLADKRKNINDLVFLLCLSAFVILIIIFAKDYIINFITDSFAVLQLQAFIASLLLFGPPTFILGVIAPYLAKLNISSTTTSGKNVAQISAAGTLGSLFGTFFTGYILFGYLGVDQILSIICLLLVIVSMLINIHPLLFVRVGIVLLALINFTTFKVPMSVIGLDAARVTDLSTKYNRALVLDSQRQGKTVRALQTDNAGWQSAILVEKPDELILPYIKALADISGLAKSGEFLHIGGGAFTLPQHLANNKPGSQIDVIEIDDKLESISSQYFKFNKPPNLKIYNLDGRQFLNSNEKKYDLVVIDAFNSLVPPFQLLTKESVQKINYSLKSDGLVAVNLIGSLNGKNSLLPSAAYTTHKEIFDNVLLIQVNPSLHPERTQNIILIASHSSLEDRLKTSSPATAKMLDAIFPAKNGMVLTDDYAPVERLGANL